MAQRTSLAPEQLRALGRLTKLRELRGFYLAGGSAVAFHLGHRWSEDLDLFAEQQTGKLQPAERALKAAEKRTQVLSVSSAALSLLWGSVPIDLVDYPYRLLERPTKGPGGFPVAGKKDLAAMKLSAIARRGIRRDFWDLYALLESGMTLQSAARAYVKRFKLGEPDLYHLMVALTYFEDAEKEAVMPAGMTSRLWEEIKEYFLQQAPRLVKRSP